MPSLSELRDFSREALLMDPLSRYIALTEALQEGEEWKAKILRKADEEGLIYDLKGEVVLRKFWEEL